MGSKIPVSSPYNAIKNNFNEVLILARLPFIQANPWSYLFSVADSYFFIIIERMVAGMQLKVIE